MNKPEFITFTGADDLTDVGEMIALSRLYPIEWGILFSRKQQGTGRYPSHQQIKNILDAFDSFPGNRELHTPNPNRAAAHLCGAYARAVLDPTRHELYGTVKFTDDDVHDISINGLLRRFHRVQVNTTAPWVDTALLMKWGITFGFRVIVQCRDNMTFPEDDAVQWLFDQSGGTGEVPSRFPLNLAAKVAGFAGGISPDNVNEILRRVSTRSPRYWIDMESGVRSDDRFDLDKCRRVCEAVYGKR